MDNVSLDLGSKDAFENAFETMWLAQIASTHAEVPPEMRKLYSKAVRYMLNVGDNLSALDYKKTELVRTDLWYRLQKLFANYDLLVCPTLAVPAFSYEIRGPQEINGVSTNPFTDWMLTNMFNLTGHPAASVPVGFTDDMLPIGMQVIGRRLEDSMVLRFSYAYEQAFPWKQHQPM